MDTSRATSSHDRPSRARWAWVGGAAIALLVGGTVAAAVLGGTSDAVLVLVGGSAAIGLLAVLLPPLIAPVDALGQRHAGMSRSTVHGPGVGAGFAAGILGGGGGGGGGDCGGGGGSSC